MERKTIKLYCPLEVKTDPDSTLGENHGDIVSEFEYATIPSSVAAVYKDEILAALEKEMHPEERERGLAKYLDSDLAAKVSYIWPSVEVWNDELYGVIDIRPSADLSSAELVDLTDWCESQLSDGLGEGFEQRPVHTRDGDLYVSFWQSGDGFFLKPEHEFKGIEPEIEAKPQELRKAFAVEAVIQPNSTPHLLPTEPQITFPATPEEVAKVCESLKVNSLSECALVGWVCPLDFLNERFTEYDWGMICGERTLDDLNILSHKIAAMSDYELAVFEGLTEIRDVTTMKELIDCAWNTGSGTIRAGICTQEQLGQEWLKNHTGRLPNDLLPFMSAEKAGAFAQKQEHGAFVAGAGYVTMADGYEFYEVYKEGISTKELADRDHIFKFTLASPTDATKTHILKLPEQECYAGEAMELLKFKLGVASLDDCAILHSECVNPRLSELLTNTRLSELYAFTSGLREMEMHGSFKFNAALEYLGYLGGENPDIGAVNHIMGSLDGFRVHHGLETPEDYARFKLKENLDGSLLENVSEIADLTAYGREKMREDNAAITSCGIVSHKDGASALWKELAARVWEQPEQTQELTMGGMY